MSSSQPCTAETLKKWGYRATPQRIAICDALHNAGSHPTVDEVHKVVVKRDPTVSLATVYKTLQLLTEIGLAREISFRDEPTRYDPTVDSHLNLVCTNCGKIDDYYLDKIDDIATTIEQRTNFSVQRQNFELYGLCSECHSKNK
ncbi:MAG: transcriptional repressor [Candidatus Thorarchaeota archaeon]